MSGLLAAQVRPAPLHFLQDVAVAHIRARQFQSGFFERALQIDPNDALALAGSAETYVNDYLYGWGDPGTDYEAKVLGQANRAIVLSPENIPAYYTKAMYLSETGRPGQALDVTDVGLAINPNDVLLYMPRASAENALGRFEQARTDAERAMWLSPRDFLSPHFS